MIDENALSWEQCLFQWGDMPTPRSHAVMWTDNEFIFVFGGIMDEREEDTYVYQLNPSKYFQDLCFFSWNVLAELCIEYQGFLIFL